MTTARKQLVSPEATPYYHCVSRCVRRSFLCGEDPVTQKSYEHRRDWIEHKVYALSQVYCIDVCAYAVMSNHYHLVLHINKEEALKLSEYEVVERWQQLHKPPLLVQNWQAGKLTSDAEKKAASSIIECWRKRLWNLSWFMKELNFDIACRANLEDNCKGHFWESRFKSQALLDEQALVAAMTYVDLNPLRSGIAKTPESSEYTSIKARIKALSNDQETAPCLYPFIGNPTNKMLKGIPFRLIDYIELVDWTARQYRENKVVLGSSLPPILQRLNISQVKWLKACTKLEQYRNTAVGCCPQIESAKRILNKRKMCVFRLDS
ncbi:transposase [Vibrio sp. SCSIO 43137]|uniref:transposase n=1 Tax=Vibrio sp. SCSIO 43137 TaxID=3021011 RepID=UPI0023072411|nr:transposase [Vibrio sp. SCSIO 43137]WCE32168.1 transposase [Vibrio sp. SCSIO 43137]